MFIYVFCCHLNKNVILKYHKELKLAPFQESPCKLIPLGTGLSSLNIHFL